MVYGGAGLFGGEIADAIEEQGDNLVITCCDIRKCKKKCEQLLLDFPNIKVKALSIELTKPRTIEKCVSDSENAFGNLDILVTCAWSGKKNSWETINDDDWNHDIRFVLMVFID